MASEVALSTHYIGKVLPDGYLEIPKTIVEHLGLKTGGVSCRAKASPGVGRKRSVRLGSHICRESLEQYLLHWARR